YVSEANARANLDAESIAASAYEQVATRARAAWNQQLSQIEIEGGTDQQRRVFTTALYLQRHQRRIHRHGPQGAPHRPQSERPVRQLLRLGCVSITVPIAHLAQ